MRKYSLIAALIFIAGCGGGNTPAPDTTTAAPPQNFNAVVPKVKAFTGDKPFQVTLYASEYPSWSTFGVASRQGLIDGAKGKLGPIEKKWNVDIEVKMVTYETCLNAWGAGGGAICITNTDIVGLVAGKPSTAIMPTSTSYGADACIGVGVTLDTLKSETTYGLSNSVSDYAWYRGLEKLNKSPADYKFSNRDPEQAAQALQTGTSKVGQVWNPFTLQTLRKKKDSKIIFDSTIIPDEIVDMVVMDNATLHKPGGDAAARCIIDTYYSVCDNLKSPDKKKSDDTYIALGDQFSSLGLDDMKLCADMASHPDPDKKVTTRFYDTPELGTKVFESGHMEPILAHILRWAKVRQLFKEEPTVSFSVGKPSNAMLTFDAQYMQGVR